MLSEPAQVLRTAEYGVIQTVHMLLGLNAGGVTDGKRLLVTVYLALVAMSV